jgi:hypothetical protein
MRMKIGAPKSNVLTSGSHVAITKSGADYSVFITTYYYFYCAYPVRYVRVLQVEYHWQSGCQPVSPS